jgi:arsenate reductase
MEKITIYEKLTCTTCRKAVKLRQANGYDFDRINYYVKPFTKNKLRTLLKKMNMKPSELLRKTNSLIKN